MQTALYSRDLTHSTAFLRTMPSSSAENGDLRTPPLTPLVPHLHHQQQQHLSRSGNGRRSPSPTVLHHHPHHDRTTAGGAATSVGSSCAPEEAADTPPQRQTTQPREASSSCVEEADAAPLRSSGRPSSDMPALMPTTAAGMTSSVSVALLNAAPPSASPTTSSNNGTHNTQASRTQSTNGAASATAAAAGNNVSKAPKRAQKTAAAVHVSRRGNSGNNPHHTNPSSTSPESSAHTTSSCTPARSTSERCKAARTLAAELMSALMERPPQAAQIAQYRQAMRASAASTPNPPPAEREHAEKSSMESAADVSSHQGSLTGGAAALSARAPSSSAASASFLEAVRNGRARSSHAAPPPPPPAATAKTSGALNTTASGASGVTSPLLSFKTGGNTPIHGPTTTGAASPLALTGASPAPTLPSAATGTGMGEYTVRKPLELMPDDAANIPRLLSVLREIALSCASLEALTRTSASATPPPSTSGSEASTSTAGAAGQHAHSAHSGRQTHRERDVVYEEQWQRVRAHLEVVRELVLNRHELAVALDEALGAEWRNLTNESAVLENSERKPSNGETSSAHEAAQPSVAKAATNTVRAAAAVDAVVPVMPTPVDHEERARASTKPATTTTSASKATTNTVVASSSTITTTTSTSTTATTTALAGDSPGAPLSVTATTTTITTTSVTTTTNTATTLNHNARPFHSRTPPSFQQATTTGPGTSGSSPPLNATPTPARSNAGASAAVNPLSASTVSTSMKQLSESSSTYSPSQHVTTFLERSTPPASGRLVEDTVEANNGGGGGLLNFPSTPLSEAAVPYQPSNTVVGGTSPRGGNASTSSSTPFHLESREEMLRRRSAAPNAFYASMTHSGATHYLGGPPSAATTPGTFVPSSVPPGSPAFALTGSGARSMPVSPLLSYGSPVAASPCPYDYILVLDFEATCEEHPPPNYLYEIIEFPVVVVDVRLQRVVAEFHRFVRPRHKLELSYFCRELTGMRQEDVDTAAPLEEVILQFERWFAHTVPPHARCVFATDGPMDMREFMYHHSVSRQGIRFPPLFYQYIDVKQTFACFFQCSQGKIKAMLEVLHVPFEGRLHSGLDDARNIASIVIGLLQYGCTFCEVPLNRLPLNGLLLSGASMNHNGSAPLSLPPSTAAAAGSGRHRSSGVSPTYIAAPYSVDEDEYSY